MIPWSVGLLVYQDLWECCQKASETPKVLSRLPLEEEEATTLVGFVCEGPELNKVRKVKLVRFRRSILDAAVSGLVLGSA
jgi:hypothetical protein